MCMSEQQTLPMHSRRFPAPETWMLRHVLVIASFFLLAGAGRVAAQNSCGSNKLSCLLPVALHTDPPTFNFFNQTFATQIAQLPLATPASGFLFTFNKRLGVFQASQESFGPLVAQRAETIGVHRIFVALTYQRFAFNVLDGNDLKKLPLVFAYPTTENPDVVTQTINRIDTKMDQYVMFATYGISGRVDVSVAVPLNRISLGVTSVGTEYSTSTNATGSFTQTVGGVASGFGDVVLAGKGTVWQNSRYGLAAGMEMRLPTGDELNLLGSGAIGVKPYFVVERRGRIAPHLNVLYQWNADSVLAAGADGVQKPLPRFFGYSGGFDTSVWRPVTLAVDLVGQHVFNAPRITTAQTISSTVPDPSVTLSSALPFTGDYETENLAVGVKVNAWKKLIAIGNVTARLNGAGLRTTLVPLVGLSYSF